MTQLVQVHILPTNSFNPVEVPFLIEDSTAIKHAAGGEFRRLLRLGWVGHHLYFTNDDKIKEGELFFNVLTNSLGDSISLVEPTSRNCRKVIATTENIKGISNIPENFIHFYVKEYNKKNKIKHVLIKVAEFINQYNTKGVTNDKTIRPFVLDNKIVLPISDRPVPLSAVREFLDYYYLYKGVQILDSEITEWFDKNYPQ